MLFEHVENFLPRVFGQIWKRFYTLHVLLDRHMGFPPDAIQHCKLEDQQCMPIFMHHRPFLCFVWLFQNRVSTVEVSEYDIELELSRG